MAEVVQKKNKGFGLLMTCFASFGGFLYGYDTGNIGIKTMEGWLHYFGDQSDGTLSTGRDSLVTSILSAGTFVGALLAYPIGKRSKRFGIMVYLVLFCIGVALQTGGKSIGPFVVGRVFAGLGVGGTSCLVPLYQSECSPSWIRGAVVAGYQWNITIGLLIASVVVNATKDRVNASCYQIPIGLQFIWAVILAGGLAVLPESPRWLILKGREDDAIRSLTRILSADPSDPEVTQEFANISANLSHQQAISSASYIDCFRNGPGRNRLRVLTGIGLQALQQLTGINFIFYYGTQFFKNSHLNNPFTVSIITNVVNVVMTVPGMWAVDKVGRRSLLLYGAAGMAASQLLVAILGDTLSADNISGQKALIALVWVVTGEIYPLSIRGRAMSMSTASNWLLNFAIGYATPYMVDSGPGKAGLHSNVFFVWGGFCVICFFFTFFCIAETKGLTLEQVDLLYRNSSIIGSNKYRKRIMEENLAEDDMDVYIQRKITRDAEHNEKASTRQISR
ncbi:MFS monosaccharide transporter [Meredithblackwellia eburnea MCA 4105]